MDVVEAVKRITSRKTDVSAKLTVDFYKDYIRVGQEPQSLQKTWEENIKPIDRENLPNIQYLNEVFKENQLRVAEEPEKVDFNNLIQQHASPHTLLTLNALRSRNKDSTLPQKIT